MCKFVAYYRVSTERQGLPNRHGLASQQAAVRAHIGEQELVAEFTEIESGRNSARPRLAEAIALAKRTKSVLIIARLDRLARNLAFVANLLDSTVEFCAADMPNANRMMLQMVAVMAEYEARLISERTRSALAAARARGVQLGNRKNLAEAQAAGHAVIVKQAADHAAAVMPTIRDIVRSGARSVHVVADAMTARGVATRRGGRWTGSAVLKVVKRSGFDSIKTLAGAL